MQRARCRSWSPEAWAVKIRCYFTWTRSTRVGSSAGARELLTRLDTGQRCSMSFAAGLSNVDPPSLSQDAKSVDSRSVYTTPLVMSRFSEPRPHWLPPPAAF